MEFTCEGCTTCWQIYLYLVGDHCWSKKYLINSVFWLSQRVKLAICAVRHAMRDMWSAFSETQHVCKLCELTGFGPQAYWEEQVGRKLPKNSVSPSNSHCGLLLPTTTMCLTNGEPSSWWAAVQREVISLHCIIPSPGYVSESGPYQPHISNENYFPADLVN